MPAKDADTTFRSLLTVETKEAKKPKGAKSLLLGRLGFEPGAPLTELKNVQRQTAAVASQFSEDSPDASQHVHHLRQVQECLDLLSSMKINLEHPDAKANLNDRSGPHEQASFLSSEQLRPSSESFLCDMKRKAAMAQTYFVQMGLSDAVDNFDDDKADEIDVEALGRLTETELAQAGLSALQRVKVGVTMGRIAPGMEAMHTLLSQLGMAQYVQLFADNEVDLDAFALLADKDFLEIGVDNEFHRQVLLSAAQPSTLMQQCLLSMLSSENQAAASAGAELDKVPIAGVTGNSSLKTESTLAQYEALDPNTSESKWNSLLKGASLEDEVEGCKRIIRELLLERSTVISRLCQEIRHVEVREAALARILESGSAGRDSGNSASVDAEKDKTEEALRLAEDAGMRSEAVKIDESIVLMLSMIGRLSNGKSDKLQRVVLDHCAPILCSLVERSLLLDWCSAILKHGLGEGNRLIWAVRAKLAEKVLFILAEDARKQAGIIETSLSTEVSTRHDYSTSREWEVKPSPVPRSGNPVSKGPATATDSSSTTSHASDEADQHLPVSHHSNAQSPLATPQASPIQATSDRTEPATGASVRTEQGFSPIPGNLSPRSQLLPRLPPIDLHEAPHERHSSSPVLVKDVHTEDDGTSQALAVKFNNMGFASVTSPLPEGLQLPDFILGWRVLRVAGVDCRFKDLEQLQELFWREHGTGSVAMVLGKAMDDSIENEDTHSLSVPAGTVVVKAQEPSESGPPLSPMEQCYLVVLRRIPRAKSSSLSEAVGVGLTLQKERDGQFRVVSLLPGGAAAESGRVGQGDLVRSINGREVQGRSVEDVMQLIKGAPGTRVAILFTPKGHGNTLAPRMRRHRAIPGWKPKMGEIKVQVASAGGLHSGKQPASIFCQLRTLSTTLDEELVGVGRAGIEIGMRVHKSRFLKEKERGFHGVEVSSEEVGTVVNIEDGGLACQVLWDDATEHWYATGLAGEFDLEVSPEVTTMCESSNNLRWDSVLTLGVRELEAAFLECSVWDADMLLGEAILQLSPLSEVPWEVVERHLALQDPDGGLEPVPSDFHKTHAKPVSPSSPSPKALDVHHGARSVHLAVCWVPMPAAPTIDNQGGMLA